jgi:hypothetical protein
MKLYSITCILLIFISSSVYSQYWKVMIQPQQARGWTGSFRNIDGDYDKTDGEIRMGKGSFYTFFRGYALFDVSEIPDDAVIHNIQLYLHPATIPVDSNIIIQLTSVPFNPLKVDPQTGYNEINNAGKLSDEGEYLRDNNVRTVVLNDVANKNLQSKLKEDQWAIGFRIKNDGLDFNQCMGSFEGHNFRDSVAPSCLVTYGFEYIRPSFKGRKIKYTKEYSFKKSELTIACWDHMKIDGDIITLYLNGEPIVSNYLLQKEKKIIKVQVRSDRPNDLFLFAHNEGKNPPNTVSLEISDGVVSKNVILSSDLSSCEAILIKVDKQ